MIPPIYSLNGLLNSNGNFSNFTKAINLAGMSTVLQGIWNSSDIADLNRFHKFLFDYQNFNNSNYQEDRTSIVKQ